ncbi:ThuA domain-containing protein [Arenibaculum pallidiluteum]|uniref:ThuA domain-containing protein n=1 Tax=Arenibaculum pallidiluteum TaxID=2812559 RepID=UPI001A974EE3|nr:ThuA domain-containing protein [Arenibaculum pallidiluteum]
MPPIPRITVWNEFWHERNDPAVAAVYPDGIHGAVAAALREHGLGEVRTATLDEPEHGLSEAVLEATDVLFWWGHRKHDAVSDAVVARVQARVLQGMGLVVLHSGHYSKIFRRLTGTACTLDYRVAGERERLWVVSPGHPVAQGLGRFFELGREEMYGEPFAIPEPDALVFISWFEGGEVFRSGCCYTRGRGRIFYFRPGHETFPTYHDPAVRRVLANAARWATPEAPAHEPPANVRRDPIEPIGR